MSETKNGSHQPLSAEDKFLGAPSGANDVARLKAIPQEKLFQSYLSVIFRFKFLIFTVAFVISAVSTYITLQMPKQYTAHAVVSLGTYLPSSEIAIARMLRDDMQSDNFIQDQLILLSNIETAEKALRHDPSILPLIIPPEKLPKAAKDKNGNLIRPELAPEILRTFLGYTGHELIRGSTMVKIIGRSTDPELSAKIANAQAHAFVEQSRAQLIQVADVNLKALKRRAKEKENEVAQKKEALRKYVKEHAYQITQNDGADRSLQLKMNNTLSQLSVATLSRAEAKTKFYELDSNGTVNGLGLGNEGRKRFIELQSSEDEMNYLIERKFDTELWWMKEKKREIESARSELKLLKRQKKQDAKIEYKANIEREELLRRELEKIKKEMSGKESERIKKARIQLEYTLLQTELGTAVAAYGELLRGLEQARMAGNADLLTVKVSDTAKVPTAPSSPKVKFNILLGTVFGLLLGISIAYLLSFADNTVRTSKQLTALLGIRMLGIVPSFSDGNKHGVYGYFDEEDSVDYDGEQVGDSSLLVLERPESLEAESFRSIRTMIKSSLSQANDGKVLLVTSGLPLDGKSTVAGNLAVSFGKTEETTVLIDGDTRKPSLHTKFGIPDTRKGLTDYLLGQCEVDDILVDSPVGSLKLIVAGTQKVPSGELLDSPKMKELMRVLEERFERVLIDSPPLSQISDALLMSKYSDGVLLVVRSGKTPRPVAEHALARLQQIKAPVIGTVLNDLRKDNSYGDAEYYSLKESHYYRKG